MYIIYESACIWYIFYIGTLDNIVRHYAPDDLTKEVTILDKFVDSLFTLLTTVLVFSLKLQIKLVKWYFSYMVKKGKERKQNKLVRKGELYALNNKKLRQVRTQRTLRREGSKRHLFQEDKKS